MEWKRTEWTRSYKSSCWTLKCAEGLVLLTVRFVFLRVQAALGNDYVAPVEQHSSQKDASKGFGGRFGVQKDRVDKVRTHTRL